ncbi:MAG: serine/threonine protein kinase [Xanthobacteraceae bacterium]
MKRQLNVGDVIDGFRLDELLPAGGMSNLWRISRSDVAFPAVMKIPLLAGSESPLVILGFEVEQMILSRLKGPHVPRFVAAGNFEGPYIVMEMIEGPSLKTKLDSLPLPCAEVAAIGARAAAALHDLHRQHVIHLDIKPSNIIMRGDDAVLIDFGLSRHTQLPDLPAEEISGPIGTGPYISPEQLDGVRDDPRSDLFALGVVLYFFATGERPFGDPRTVREWRKRLYVDPTPPRSIRPDITPWMQEIILRCLERDPARRHQTAAQLAFDLTHPEQIALTARAQATRTGGVLGALGRRFARWRPKPVAVEARKPAHKNTAPIIIAAIDLEAAPALADAMRENLRRIIAAEPGARLACVNIFRLAKLAIDRFEDEEGRNIHLKRLAELEYWVHPIRDATGHVTFHVLEAVDPASALIEFARRSHADHIVLGARGASALRRYLGSVSAQVVSEAQCTVTVVRAGNEGE